MISDRVRRAWARHIEFRLAFRGGALNAGWEFAHSPLYADHDRALGHLLWTRLHCAAGDVLILLGAFWLTSLLLRCRHWWNAPGRTGAILFVASGLVYTGWSEWFHTTITGAWAYAPSMPQLAGLGVTPLLQWLLLPPLALALARRRTPRRQGVEEPTFHS